MKAVFIFLFLFFFFRGFSTHLHSAEITLKLKNDFTYLVTIKAYTNLGTNIVFGNGILDFGDGSPSLTTPAISSQFTIYKSIGFVQYTTEHTFPKAGSYVITYSEPNLVGGLINVDNSLETKLYLESKVILETGRDSSSPVFLADPFFRHPIGRDYSISAQAVDANGYQLTYDIWFPLAPGQTNYTKPESLVINNSNGLITWDTKYKNALLVGEYYFGVRITQWDSKGNVVGYTCRTYESILEDANSSLETINSLNESDNRILVLPGIEKKIKVILSDNASVDKVKWQLYADSKIISNLKFTQYDSVANARKIKVGLLSIKTTDNIVRDIPYSITLRGMSTMLMGGSMSPSDIIYSRDISYNFFTRDVQLPVVHLPVVTSVDEIPAGKIIAYPNPFLNDLLIEDTTKGDFEITLFSILGKRLLTSFASSELHIDTSGMPPGLYIVEVVQGQRKSQLKLVRR
ncbi:MAG: T9SS type A sorting domain-containing protein [Bacteroidota bacterium]